MLSEYISNGLKIKWPNDIYINDKKIGGVLIQNGISGAFIKNTIVGIGLNINEANFPTNLLNPISLLDYTGETHEIAKPILALL